MLNEVPCPRPRKKTNLFKKSWCHQIPHDMLVALEPRIERHHCDVMMRQHSLEDLRYPSAAIELPVSPELDILRLLIVGQNDRWPAERAHPNLGERRGVLGCLAVEPGPLSAMLSFKIEDCRNAASIVSRRSTIVWNARVWFG